VKARWIGWAGVALGLAWAQYQSDAALVGPRACPKPVAYWQGARWPVQQLFLGGQLRPEAELRAILRRTDASGPTRFVQNLIAVKLSLAAGAEPSAAVGIVLEAERRFAEAPPLLADALEAYTQHRYTPGCRR